MLTELYTLAYSGKRIESLVQIKILFAIMNKMIGSREEAVKSLIEAMEFAANEKRALPLQFIISPDLPDYVDTITLSYTYFETSYVTRR